LHTWIKANIELSKFQKEKVRHWKMEQVKNKPLITLARY
jgi:hypothetical protein